jgi:hypothetical protein
VHHGRSKVKVVASLLRTIKLVWPRRGPLPIHASGSAPSRHPDARSGPIRAPVRNRDLELSDKAAQWLGRLPDGAQPLELSRAFPRIVNQIAAVWRDEGLTDYALGVLLTDTRGGRQGFPLAIVRELEILCELHVKRAASQLESNVPTPEDRPITKRALNHSETA